MKKSTWSRTLLIAVLVVLAVMVSGSMNAADSTKKKIDRSTKIHTEIYNQFNTSNHYLSR